MYLKQTLTSQTLSSQHSGELFVLEKLNLGHVGVVLCSQPLAKSRVLEKRLHQTGSGTKPAADIISRNFQKETKAAMKFFRAVGGEERENRESNSGISPLHASLYHYPNTEIILLDNLSLFHLPCLSPCSGHRNAIVLYENGQTKQ